MVQQSYTLHCTPLPIPTKGKKSQQLFLLVGLDFSMDIYRGGRVQGQSSIWCCGVKSSLWKRFVNTAGCCWRLRKMRTEERFLDLLMRNNWWSSSNESPHVVHGPLGGQVNPHWNLSESAGSLCRYMGAWGTIPQTFFCLRYVCSLVAQSCRTLCNLLDYSPPGSSVHGIFRQEYWSGLPFSPPRDLPDSGIEPESLASPELQADYCWAIREALFCPKASLNEFLRVSTIWYS